MQASQSVRAPSGSSRQPNDTRVGRNGSSPAILAGRTCQNAPAGWSPRCPRRGPSTRPAFIVSLLYRELSRDHLPGSPAWLHALASQNPPVCHRARHPEGGLRRIRPCVLYGTENRTSLVLVRVQVGFLIHRAGCSRIPAGHCELGSPRGPRRASERTRTREQLWNFSADHGGPGHWELQGERPSVLLRGPEGCRLSGGGGVLQ